MMTYVRELGLIDSVVKTNTNITKMFKAKLLHKDKCKKQVPEKTAEILRN